MYVFCALRCIIILADGLVHIFSVIAPFGCIIRVYIYIYIYYSDDTDTICRKRITDNERCFPPATVSISFSLFLTVHSYTTRVVRYGIHTFKFRTDNRRKSLTTRFCTKKFGQKQNFTTTGYN
jgi:uncharacterized membrane protein